jgi:FMN-dependent oxidoreductase (nitrilotriacetate monooxygenase family)
MEVVMGLWRSWDDDALIQDKAGNRFADPKKVHALAHHGKFFSSHGPLPVPRSPQGQPVIIQAGQSGRGRAFACRWGEIIFTSFASAESGRKTYAEMKQAIAAGGRDPASVNVATMIYPVVDESAARAEEKLAYIQSLAQPGDGPVVLSELLNFDFSGKRPDEPLSDEEMARISGGQAFLERIKLLSGRRNPSLEDCMRYTPSVCPRGPQLIAGTPKAVADKLEEWFHGGVCDGFVTAATCIPGTYEDFVRLVVPELQRRGVFRREYEGATLRENLGLAKPR